jgi:hypothetical protein
VLGEQGVADVAAFVLTNLDGRSLPADAKADPAKGKQSSPPPAWPATGRKARH